MEEKLLEQEKRLRSELSVEVESQEIEERLASLQEARELQEMKSRQSAEMIEELKKRLSQDLREHSSALGELRSELEEVHNEARENEAKAITFQVCSAHKAVTYYFMV